MKTKLLTRTLLGLAAAFLLSFTAVSPLSHKSMPLEVPQLKDSLKLTKEQLIKYCGEYLPSPGDSKMTLMSVVMHGDFIYRHVNNDYVRLQAVASDKFIYADNSGRSLAFTMGKDGSPTEVTVTRPDGVFTMKRNLSAVAKAGVVSTLNKTDQIARLMEKYAEYGLFNGSVLVAEKGKVIYKKGFGWANAEWKIANQPDTKFRLASVSKQFTTLLILQLMNEGQLKLDVPITTYLPTYPKEQGDQITLHHLMTHSSGIPNFTSFPDYKKMIHNQHSPEQLVKIFAGLPLEFKPGEKFAYSNSGYVLLGYIIEKVSGKTYEQCLQERIFTPLKMTSSGLDHYEAVIEKRATGYDKSGSTLMTAGHIDMSIPFSAGALYSTVEDLYLWDQALQTDILLPAKTRELLFTKHMPDHGRYYGYGWGLQHITLSSAAPVLVTEHSGGIEGFNTLISRIPADKNVAIFLNNVSNAPLSEMNYAVRAILYDLPYDLPKKSLAIAMQQLIAKEGLRAATAKFTEYKSSGVYAINEGEINEVGYGFLNVGKTAEAIEFFKWNVEIFPASGNCYDSLGEAYLKSGNKELAIKNYKKSVELDPQNENGKKVLADISK
jgi:CubicO group peptidase (beta-lactamase class C family)